jgi:acyl-CoA reductase-like NAD-dependent aldehyde dehydrogenase
MQAATLDETRQARGAHSVQEYAAEREAARTIWMATTVQERVKMLRATRHRLARMTLDLAEAISPALSRTPADTRAAEILPLLAACQFLERNASRLLAPHRLGRRGLPFWLAGVESTVERVPLGHVLLIGPANYPLFLPGVQVLQAIAAGNTVTWKPGRGGKRVADLVAAALKAAGLPDGVLQITDESVTAVDEALARNPAKVFFTGSAETGRLIMRKLAETLTPSVMELSGCDAVVVLPSADLQRVVQALVFGMRLNGSATCMAPRRVVLLDSTSERREIFLATLLRELQEVEAVQVPDEVRRKLETLLAAAQSAGARVHGTLNGEMISPLVVTGARPEMELCQADLFAPVLSIMDLSDEAELLAAQAACPFALTAAIFGHEKEAQRLAAALAVGSVLINDIIVPTADPRVPFGGRGKSGFGVTRGAEGLLEMTAIRTIAVRRGRSTRHYEQTTSRHAPLFDGLIMAAHGRSWKERCQGLGQVIRAGKELKRKG